MRLPEIFEVLVITLSDRAAAGEYSDLSGPAVRERLEAFFREEGWKSVIRMELIPDDPLRLSELIKDSAESANLIITTGGTGIGPRDITVDTIAPLITRGIPGIMEFIRVKYGMEKPNALLSRGIAGIAGKSLIYTLPGSVKAVEEYMTEILRTLKHTVLMQYGIDSHARH
jgi:molybdopterin adenylyltransferase